MCLCVCVYVYMYVCVLYVCMYVCMYVHKEHFYQPGWYVSNSSSLSALRIKGILSRSNSRVPNTKWGLRFSCVITCPNFPPKSFPRAALNSTFAAKNISSLHHPRFKYSRKAGALYSENASVTSVSPDDQSCHLGSHIGVTITSHEPMILPMLPLSCSAGFLLSWLMHAACVCVYICMYVCVYNL